MKVLITGSTGFVGKYIVNRLLEEGYEVASAVRNTKKLQRLYGNSVKGYKVDFESEESLKEAFGDFRPDFVVHLIGILYEERSKGVTFHKVHHVYSKNLYEVAKGFDIKKVVHMSALGTDRSSPSSYHKTKYMGEKELINSGINYTIFRPSIILGPEQRLFYDMWKITKYIPIVALPNFGGYKFQPVDVRDVACCFVKALSNQETDKKTYEVCGSKKVSFKELLEDIFFLFGKRVFLLPVPKFIMYVGGILMERILEPPLFSSDQILMMWRENVCGLSSHVHSKGVESVCGKEPIGYEESLRWSIEEFLKKVK
ncbi:MAG: NAD-dependent epimerase/dehydratase family protein [Aquificaceae bacterium]